MKRKSNKVYHTKKELFLILFNLMYIVFVPTFKLTVGIVTMFVAATFADLTADFAMVMFIGFLLWVLRDFVKLYYSKQK